MSAVGLIDKYARSFINCAIRQGYSLETICAAADVDPVVFQSESLRYGPEELARISRHVKLMMDDEFCGLARRRCKAGTLLLCCELIMPSKTLREALDKAFRFFAALGDDIQFDLTEKDGRATIRLHMMEPERDLGSCLAEWFLLVWRSLSGWLIGEEVTALKTCFEHDMVGSYEEYVLVFGEECLFGQAENSVTFDAQHLSGRVVKNMDDFQEFYSTSEIDLVSYAGIDLSMASRIRALLKDYFFEAQKFYPMETVASKFHLSVQSLRRRLEEEGFSYRGIKEDIRREAAIAWLRDDRIPIAEISRMCGFSESNGLSRAMKTWVGMSPSAYRDTVLREQRV